MLQCDTKNNKCIKINKTNNTNISQSIRSFLKINLIQYYYRGMNISFNTVYNISINRAVMRFK